MEQREFGHIGVGDRLAELNNYDDKCVVSMSGILQLYVCLRGITDKEVKQCQDGDFEIGLSEVGGVLFITFYLDGIIKAETAFNANLCDRDNIGSLEPFPDGIGYGCSIFGVDSDTGIVKSVRVVGLGTEFSNGLKEYIKKQLANKEFNAYKYKISCYGAMTDYSSDDIFGNQKYVYKHKSNRGSNSD